jgi:glycosyltransferase involved in cell wall biosynthesis
VLQDPELAQGLVSNARLEFQRYSWPVVREQWLEVYRALASGEMREARAFASNGINSSER